jgi:hypothetical protein
MGCGLTVKQIWGKYKKVWFEVKNILTAFTLKQQALLSFKTKPVQQRASSPVKFSFPVRWPVVHHRAGVFKILLLQK